MIGDLFFGNNGVFDLILQKLVAGEHSEIAVQRGLLVPAFFPIGFGQTSGTQQRANRQQFHRIEETALLGTVERIGDVLYARKGRAALQADKLRGILGLLLQFFTLGQRGLGPQLPAQFFGRRRGSLSRQQFQNLWEFNGGKRLFL